MEQQREKNEVREDDKEEECGTLAWMRTESNEGLIYKHGSTYFVLPTVISVSVVKPKYKDNQLFG